MKISFCTTCMNRCEHIKKTLPINLSIIKKFNNLNKNKFELSLCNYDSKDDLDDYIKNNYINEIKSGIFIYTVVKKKDIFNPGHAKNIAHKKSTGDILVNIDADNFISEKFVNKVIELFENNINTITLGYLDNYESGAYGRIAISRNNFYKLGGYFEKFIGYGTQDYDLYARGITYLNLSKYIFEKEYVDFITHDNLSRVINYDKTLYNLNNIEDFNNIYSNIELDMEYNIIESKHYFDLKIININEYNNIIFGEC